jgi:hypothetical protein
VICFFEISTGSTLSLAITPYAGSGVCDCTRNSYDLRGHVLQYRWLRGARWQIRQGSARCPPAGSRAAA